MKKLLLLGIIGILYCLTACNDQTVSPIPSYPVYLNLNLTVSYPLFRNSIDQILLFEKRINETDRIGYGGIIVYTGFDGGYYAFDMSCPYEAKATTKVRPRVGANGQPEVDGQVVCDSCKSVFDISYGFGNPISGKSKQPLKRYKTSLSGDYLTIIN
jgi:nitrite reductase/ring-hydroxylating ferredoxin subunit